MAIKKIFRTGDDERLFYVEDKEYVYYGGFAASQRKKCVVSLHEAIQKKYPDSNILEISTKSTNPFGVKLSAFNLLYQGEGVNKPVTVECVFQAAKHFANGGPYVDLLEKSSREAKKDVRLRESGPLVSFDLAGRCWPLKPVTLFYDWIYINALAQNKEYAKEIEGYDIFTDIEFNHNKSMNCQARSAAIFRTLQKRGILQDVLEGRIDFASLYPRF